VDLIERLLAIDVSALSDADKTLPVVEPAVPSPSWPRTTICP
jgi:hypothetical protein